MEGKSIQMLCVSVKTQSFLLEVLFEMDKSIIWDIILEICLQCFSELKKNP